MFSPRSSLPKETTQGYWTEVSRVLQTNHHLTKRASSAAIANYRKALAEDGVNDIIYHSPIGETVDGIVVGGYLAKKKQPQAELAPTQKKQPRKKSALVPKDHVGAKSAPKHSARKATKPIK